MNLNVEVSSLLAVLHKNLETHRQGYEEALVKWKDAAIDELEGFITGLKAGRKIFIRSMLPVPEEHSEDYVAAIGLLEMAVDKTIRLSQAEYQMYVLDKWGWASSFAANTSRYTAREIQVN